MGREHALRGLQDDPEDTEESRISFVSTLTAFGLAATGSMDYA